MGEKDWLKKCFRVILSLLTFTRRHGQGNEEGCRTRTRSKAEGDEGEGHEGQGHQGHEGKEVKPPLSRVQSTCCAQRTPVVLAHTGDTSLVDTANKVRLRRTEVLHQSPNPSGKHRRH